ncbi:MAG: nitrogenase cofactor biosynthesis protein NifB [Bacteroidetes bacterium]|jgi:nitrogen fixation protein NifB|nr:nitrogenase cofactor biosynthesis protein NifB [Bacteroidota bacterium]
MEQTAVHPCFDKKAKLKYARVHLPVAPKCNIQCNYCNRKYDCVNESRPGITTAVLSPYQALEYMNRISAKVKNISTVGIAGPGDAFADPERTLETLRLIKQNYPDKIFCISTNGLVLADYVDELVKLDVTHVTITMNSIRADTVVNIYPYVRYNKRMYRGRQAAELLIEKQKEGLRKLKEKNIKVKINAVVIPGVNDHEMEELARYVALEGADTMNCIPLIPADGSAWEDREAPSHEMIRDIHNKISAYITPMTHCARCRADAAGLLGKDEPDVLKTLQQCSVLPVAVSPEKPYVAVASYEGLLINQHLGEADHFYIYKQQGDGYELVEKRPAPQRGEGDLRWIRLSKSLHDCGYVLVNGVGAKPVEILERSGIAVTEMSGLIEDGLDAAYKGKKLKAVLKVTPAKCGEACNGNGMGCG